MTFKRSSKVIQGHERSKIDILVKIRLRQEFDVPDSRGGGGGSFRVGGRANFYAGRIAYSECEYISVFTEFIVRFIIFLFIFIFFIYFYFFLLFIICYLVSFV